MSLVSAGSGRGTHLSRSFEHPGSSMAVAADTERATDSRTDRVREHVQLLTPEG